MALLALPSYCTQAHVESCLSAYCVLARLDDDADSQVSTTEQDRMTIAVARGTETCNFYLYWFYEPSWLVQSNIVNHWCTDLAAYCVCRMARLNPVPESAIEAAQEAKDMMDRIMKGWNSVPGIPKRRMPVGVFDNLRADPRYRFQVIRVESNTSSPQPTQKPVNVDWQDNYTLEF